MKQRSFLWLFFCLVIFGFFADQITKYQVFSRLTKDGDPGEYDVIPGWFKLRAFPALGAESKDWFLVRWNGPIPPAVNHGALWGLGDNHKEVANGVFMGIASVLSIAILIWAIRRKTRSDLVLMISLGLILSGSLGNLFDRIVFGGVRDFFCFYYFPFPDFNVADSALVCGAGLLLFQALFLLPAPKEESCSQQVQLG